MPMAKMTGVNKAPFKNTKGTAVPKAKNAAPVASSGIMKTPPKSHALLKPIQAKPPESQGGEKLLVSKAALAKTYGDLVGNDTVGYQKSGAWSGPAKLAKKGGSRGER